MPLISTRGRLAIAASTGDVLTAGTQTQCNLNAIQRGFFSEFGSDVFVTSFFSPSMLFEYGQTEGHIALRELLSALVGRPADELVITDGASQALLLLFATLLEPGDELLIPCPGFPAYQRIGSLFGGISKYYQWSDEPLELTSSIRRTATARTKLIVVNNPNNPTGVSLSNSSLEYLLEAAETLGIFVVLDEAYTWLAGPVDKLTSVDMKDRRLKVAVVGSFGKYLCLPGLRLGFAVVCDKSIRDTIVEIKRHVSLASCPASEALAVSLLQSPTLNHVKISILHALNARRSCIVSLLQSIDAKPVDRSVGFYIFAEQGVFAERVGVTGVPGAIFGGSASSRRFSLAVDESTWRHIENMMTKFSSDPPAIF